MSFALSDIERRLANLLRVGTVASVDHEKALARVSIGEVLTVPLPWLTLRAGEDRTWWPVEVGEQVVVLSPSGDMTQGLILGSLFRTSAPAPSSSPGVDRREYGDGAVIQYDRNTHKLTADIPGDASISATGDIEATSGGSITGTAGDTITMSAPLIILSAELIRLAGPLVAAGLDGESYTAKFSGDITQINGDYTNPDGDAVAGGISLRHHKHMATTEGAETSEPI